MIRSSIVAAMMATTLIPAAADAPDWKALMNGVDGVITYCDSSTRQQYAETMCTAVSDEIAKGFGGSGLTVTHNGFVLTGSASEDNVPSEIATTDLKKAEGMSHPLLVGIVLKGTDDGNPAIYMRVQFLIPVELHASGSPAKAGELFILERAVVGNGPKKRLPAAQISFINKAVAPLIADIRAGMKPD